MQKEGAAKIHTFILTETFEKALILYTKSRRTASGFKRQNDADGNYSLSFRR